MIEPASAAPCLGAPRAFMFFLRPISKQGVDGPETPANDASGNAQRKS
jgi:hypothetical protein